MTDDMFVLPAHPLSLTRWQDLTPNEQAWVQFIRVISGGSDPGITVTGIRALREALDGERATG